MKDTYMMALFLLGYLMGGALVLWAYGKFIAPLHTSNKPVPVAQEAEKNPGEIKTIRHEPQERVRILRLKDNEIAYIWPEG
jgi:hypothetical protein